MIPFTSELKRAPFEAYRETITEYPGARNVEVKKRKQWNTLFYTSLFQRFSALQVDDKKDEDVVAVLLDEPAPDG